MGCGPGELTRALHEKLAAASTVGLDSSPAMLEKAAKYSTDGLSFRLQPIEKAGFQVAASHYHTYQRGAVMTVRFPF